MVKESDFFTETKIRVNRYRQALSMLTKHRFLIPYILQNYYHMLALKRRRIRLLEISVCYECNYKCPQCSGALSIDTDRQRLTLNEFKRLIDEAIGLGAFQFNITGGEPLLFGETLALIDYIRSRNRYAHLVTNGSFIDGAMMDKLAKLDLNSIEMGLDSADAMTHDKSREAVGSYNKIMDVVRLAKKKNIIVILNTIITHEKIKNGDMENLVRLTGQKRCFLQITPPCVTGRWSKRYDILLDRDEIRYFRKLIARPYVRSDIFSAFFGLYCSAGTEKFGITPYGDVIPCGLIQLPYGNIKERPLKSIWVDILKNLYYTGRCPYGCLSSFNRDFINRYL